MRWLVIGAATWLGFANPAAAQNAAIPPLERSIDVNYRIPLPAHECTVPSVVARLARQYQFSAGVEYLLVDCQRLFAESRRDGETIDLYGLSIGDALKKLATIDSRYRWVERDGLVLVRPREAWTDPKNMLNSTTESFVLDDVNVGSALSVVVSALSGQPRSHLMLEQSSERTEQGRRRFSVKTGTVSAAEALDAIVRAHGDAWWEFKRSFTLPDWFPTVYIQTFDGTGLGVSIHKP
jgi:hypothetical protein